MSAKTGSEQVDKTKSELYFLGGWAFDGGLLGGKNQSIIISYMAMRQLIGVLGILLPFICILGGLLFSGLPSQRSISFYYHTNMRDFFIGILLTVSIFLITYKGNRTIDSVVTTLIGVAGINVALFPTMGVAGAPAQVGLFQVGAGFANAVHLTAAALFFILLALNSMFLFTLSKDKIPPPGSNKKYRNWIYLACGVIILVCLVLFVLLDKVMSSKSFAEGGVILILESVMLAAFGVSWLVKGEAILKDAKVQVKQLRAKK